LIEDTLETRASPPTFPCPLYCPLLCLFPPSRPPLVCCWFRTPLRRRAVWFTTSMAIVAPTPLLTFVRRGFVECVFCFVPVTHYLFLWNVVPLWGVLRPPRMSFAFGPHFSRLGCFFGPLSFSTHPSFENPFSGPVFPGVEPCVSLFTDRPAPAFFSFSTLPPVRNWHWIPLFVGTWCPLYSRSHSGSCFALAFSVDSTGWVRR